MFLPTMSCPLNFIFFSLLNCIWNFFYIHMHHLRDIQAHPVNKETTGSAKLSLEKVVNPKICGGEAGLEKYWLVKHFLHQSCFLCRWPRRWNTFFGCIRWTATRWQRWHRPTTQRATVPMTTALTFDLSSITPAGAGSSGVSTSR